MKMRLRPIIFLLAAFTIAWFIPACKKDKCKSGTGGSLTLRFNTMHHSKNIPGCTVRIKFDTQDFPGENGAYDITKTAADSISYVTFSGLQCGDYYIYGTGIDSALTSTNKTVKGGIPYSTTQESGTIVLTLPITE